MCPFYNPVRKECKIVPWDSSAMRDSADIAHKCGSASDNYRRCGNVQAYERGEYKIER